MREEVYEILPFILDISNDTFESQKLTKLSMLPGRFARLLLSWPESQKPRQRVSNADRKVFANPESFCDKFIIG